MYSYRVETESRGIKGCNCITVIGESRGIKGWLLNFYSLHTLKYKQYNKRHTV